MLVSTLRHPAAAAQDPATRSTQNIEAPRSAVATAEPSTLFGRRHEVDSKRQPVRVLLVAGRPGWTFRYLRHAWRRDEGTTVSWSVQSAAPEGQLGQIERLPDSYAAWSAFDVVVLCDDALSDPVTRQQWLPELRGFVERGGGLAIFADAGLVARCQAPAWRPLLPIELANGPATDVVKEACVLQLAPGAESHRALQWGLGENVAESLAKLPAISVHRQAVRVRPGGQALLLGPTSGPDGRAAATVVVASGAIGNGRAVWVGTDELWRWRDPFAERYHDAFALGVLHALVPGR